MALRLGKKKAAKKKGMVDRRAPAKKKAAPRKHPARDDLRERVARLETLVEELRRRIEARPEIDPGDAVPPGVAVQDAEPPDEEAKRVQASLESHLHSGEPE